MAIFSQPFKITVEQKVDHYIDLSVQILLRLALLPPSEISLQALSLILNDMAPVAEPSEIAHLRRRLSSTRH